VTQGLDRQTQLGDAPRWQLDFKAKSFERIQVTPSRFPAVTSSQ